MIFNEKCIETINYFNTIRLAAAASATNTDIHKKMFESSLPLDLASRITTLTISN